LRHYPREQAEAFEHLDTATAELRDMKMQPALERALALHDTYHRPQVRMPAYPDGLSEREVEVLGLVAQGKSNQQIADELVISQTPVAHHVGNILSKTATANRAEAGAYAHRHGLV